MYFNGWNAWQPLVVLHSGFTRIMSIISHMYTSENDVPLEYLIDFFLDAAAGFSGNDRCLFHDGKVRVFCPLDERINSLQLPVRSWVDRMLSVVLNVFASFCVNNNSFSLGTICVRGKGKSCKFRVCRCGLAQLAGAGGTPSVDVIYSLQ